MKNPNKPEINEYHRLHEYIRKIFPKPKACEHCKKETSDLDLSNKSQLYQKEISDWQYLCPRCHLIYDKIITFKTKWWETHPKTEPIGDKRREYELLYSKWFRQENYARESKKWHEYYVKNKNRILGRAKRYWQENQEAIQFKQKLRYSNLTTEEKELRNKQLYYRMKTNPMSNSKNVFRQKKYYEKNKDKIRKAQRIESMTEEKRISVNQRRVERNQTRWQEHPDIHLKKLEYQRTLRKDKTPEQKQRDREIAQMSYAKRMLNPEYRQRYLEKKRLRELKRRNSKKMILSEALEPSVKKG